MEEKQQEKRRFTYGPVPSRRLGRSLGVSPIPPKTCSYTCVYCQLGKTTNLTSTRQSFYKKEISSMRFSHEAKTRVLITSLSLEMGSLPSVKIWTG